MVTATQEPLPGTSGRRRQGPLVWTVLMIGAVVAAAAWTMLGLPGLAAAQAEETPLWSAEIKVVKLENGAAGAVSASDFSNQAGSAGLTARWLYHYAGDGKLRLSFTDGAETAGHVLQVGHLTLPFDEDRSGDSSFTWDNVTVDWEGGQTVTARIVPGSETDIPATGLPEITGRAQVGETLTADVSGISDPNGLTNVSWQYQWQADGTDISLAANSAYTPVPGDLGKTIRVKVTFKDDNDNDEELTSEPTAAVIAANTQATGAPDISGDPKVRQTLTAGVSGITDADGIATVEYAYQWTADDTDIEGATGSTYKLTSAEIGKTIKVTVTFTDDAGNPETLTSIATSAVENGPPDTPEITSARRVHVGMHKVNWNDVDDVSSYELQYHQYEINWLTLPHENLNYEAHYDGSYALVDGLPYESFYSFRVRAVNDAGASEWSETYTNGYHPRELYGPDTSARPRLAGSPSKPQELSASSAGHLEVKLSWSAPEESGDSAIVGYRVEYKPVGTKIWSFLAVTEETSYRHTGLGPGRKFYYRVSAFNSDARGQNTERIRGISTVKTGVGKWQPRIHRVADDWELLPEGVDWKHGDRFRLMFITADSRDANSDRIEDYNKFVQDATAAGHADIQDYSADFRALASTVAVDAIDNTGTNWTESDLGLPVYWLKGTRVADDYKDLYDGDWDDPRFQAVETEVWWRERDKDGNQIIKTGIQIHYKFDASLGEYVYTDEHGVSMYNRHCHGYYWTSYELEEVFQVDIMPCIATGSTNAGKAEFEADYENCGFYMTLGSPCNEVSFGRPTRILPEEGGSVSPLPEIDPTLSFDYRDTVPLFDTEEREGHPEWSIWLTPMSEGYISSTFLFYAISPVFEVEADPALRVADAEATEGSDATLDFTVTLHPAASTGVTVDYVTSDGTATAGSDYTSTSGTLTFAAGVTTKTVSVPIIDDTVSDDGETFTLTLSNASGADIDDSEATGTIRNTEANTAAGGSVTITGTPQVGQTLTADVTGVTDADGLDNVEYNYQWIAGGSDIAGATNATFLLTDSQEGKTIQVRITFSDDNDNAETLTSAATVAVAARPNREPTGAPTISGTPRVEQTLTADTSSINDADGLTNVSYAYQWIASDTDIAGATGSSYELTASEQGKTIQVQVTFEDDRGHTETLTSAATVATAAKPNVTPTGLPTISGTPQVDQTLTADTSSINDADGLTNVSYAYQWIASDTDIAGATGSSYTLTYSEQGQTIQVRVTFTDDADNEETLTSAATVAVAAAPNREATGQPAISGTPQVEQTLTADTSAVTDQDGLTNVSYEYQWLAGGTDISGATGSSYQLTSSEEGKTIQVKVTFTDDRGNSESLTSAATDAVAAKPLPLTASVSGLPETHSVAGTTFQFTTTFSENVRSGFAKIRDHAFTESGADITVAKRTHPQADDRDRVWTITVKVNENHIGAVTLTLPETTDCGSARAICTFDDRKLSHSTSVSVAGPN